MLKIVEGVDPTLWVFVGLAIVAAFLAGMATMGTTLSIRHYRRQLAQRKPPKPSFNERAKAAAQAVAEPGYGRAAVAVDPEPTVRIPDGWRTAGLELPPRAGVVLGEPPAVPSGPDRLGQATAVELDAALQDAAVVLEEIRHAGSSGDAVDGSGGVEADRDDRSEHDDDGPPSGGNALAHTAVQPRYDWAHLRGEKLPTPGPWRAPLQWLERVATRAVAVWHLGSRTDRWRYRLRLVATKLWAYQVRYTAVGRHDADRLRTRSWDEVAAERLTRWAKESRGIAGVPPWMRCVP